MAGYFSRQRLKFSEALGQSRAYWRVSPLMYSAWRVLISVIPDSARGEVLDAGAGLLTARPLLVPYVSHYVSMDVERHHSSVDIEDDIQTLATISSDRFDTVYSSQVLEHIPRPQDAIHQMYRVLKPGGRLLLTVPHLSHLHEEPHDYFRYTPHALRYMVEHAGFKLVSLVKIGGLLSFLVHPICMMLVLMLWPVPLLRTAMFWLNFCLLVWPAAWLDRVLGLEAKYPANILIIVEKPAEAAAGQ